MRPLLGLIILSGILFLGMPCHAAQVVLLLEHEQASPWTDMLREGLKKAQAEFNLDTEVIIAPAGQDQTAIFRAAAESSQLILVTGENLHEILRDNASRYRRVKFACIDAGIRASNIMCVTFADQEAAFLAGVAAALATQNTNLPGINGQNVIGWLSGMDTLAMRTLYNGFQEGAKLVSPEITIAQGLVNSFTDPNMAEQKTREILNAGADIVVLATGAGNAGAAKALARTNAWRIDVDKPEPSPNVLATIAKKADQAVYELVKAFATNTFQGKQIIAYDLKNGGAVLEGVDAFVQKNKKRISPDFQRRLKEIRSELLDGNIHIRSLRARTLCDCLD